jgi:hypothetical protein
MIRHKAVLHPFRLIREDPLFPLLQEIGFVLRDGVDLDRSCISPKNKLQRVNLLIIMGDDPTVLIP